MSYPHQAGNAPLSPGSYMSSPPPPPPKPASQEQYQTSGPPGLPLRPPPPTQQQAQQQTYLQSQPTLSQRAITNPPPPAIEDYWLPEIVQDKGKPDLESLLQSAELLSSLTSAPSTTHPSHTASLAPLSTALQTNTTLANNLNTLSHDLSTLRATLTQRLLSLHALERQWRNKQSELDNALDPWSPKALHARLVASIGEQEMLCRALEESFLDSQEGRASEREVADWVRRYKEGRIVLGLRKERRARFEEGRVGGWR